MIEYRGLWFPDGEEHVPAWMEQTGQERGGKPAYQLHKYEAALLYARGRRAAVDVGANVGLWSRVMALDFQRVVAFEPVPAYAACWRRNVTAPNAILTQEALGIREGRVDLHRPDAKSNGDTWVAAPGEAGNAAAGVQMRTLDSWDLSDVDLVKVDCEGYELFVLEGAQQTLLRCRPCVIVEQKPGRGAKYGLDAQAAVSFLQSLGAKVCREISGDYILAWV